MDFYMREPLKRFDGITELVARVAASGKNVDENNADIKDFTLALQDAVKEATANTFVNTYYEAGGWRALTNFLKSRGYQAALASFPRMGAEFTSNTLYAGIVYTKSWGKGVFELGAKTLNQRDFNSDDIREFARLVGTTQYSRLFQKTGSLYQETAGTMGTRVVRSANAVKKGARKLDSLVTGLSSFLTEEGDRAVAQPLWLGGFMMEYKKATGEEIDIKKYIEDSEYRHQRTDAINKARDESDKKLTEGFATFNPFDGVVDIMGVANEGWFKTFNKYMQRFVRFEYQSFEDAVRGMMNRGELSRKEGSLLMFGTLARMTAYNVIYRQGADMFHRLVENLLGWDSPEKDDEDLLGEAYKGLVGSALTLTIGRRMGNVGKVLPYFGLEYMNKMYGDKLGFRDDENYNAYQDGLVWTTLQVPSSDRSYYNFSDPAINTLIKTSGPFSTFLSYLYRSGSSYYSYLYTKTPSTRAKHYSRLKNNLFAAMAAGGGMPAAKDVIRQQSRKNSAMYAKEISDPIFKAALQEDATPSDKEAAIQLLDKRVMEDRKKLEGEVKTLLKSKKWEKMDEDARALELAKLSHAHYVSAEYVKGNVRYSYSETYKQAKKKVEGD